MLAILFVAFVWPGPGGVLLASGSSIVDEELVEEVFFWVAPAVVEVYSDLETEDSFVEITSGSGFLIVYQGHIITNNHVVKEGNLNSLSLFDGTKAGAAILELRVLLALTAQR